MKDFSDDTPTMEWVKTQRREDWTCGYWARAKNVLGAYPDDFPTIGHIRRADVKLLRLPNMGPKVYAELMSKLEHPPLLPADAETLDDILATIASMRQQLDSLERVIKNALADKCCQ